MVGSLRNRVGGGTHLDMSKLNSQTNRAVYVRVIPALIRRMTVIDDLPFVSASCMRAAGEIRAEDRTAVVRFGDLAFTVGLQHIRFPNGGGWSFFICKCGRRCRTLRFHQGSLACKGCLEANGLRYQVEDLSRGERAAHTASRLKARFAAPARLNPRPGRRLDRRGRLAAALWRAEYVAARHLIGKDDA
jgi:hypothetical protein